MTATKEKSPREPRKKTAAEYVHENVKRDEARDAEHAAESRSLPAYALAECIDIYSNHLQTPIVAARIRTNKHAELN